MHVAALNPQFVAEENVPAEFLAKEKEIEDRWRKMPSPQAGRHLANHVEAEVVEALRNAVVAAYPKLSHRYYRLKAKWMGLERMEVWDRNAPLPIETPRLVGWESNVMDHHYSILKIRLINLISIILNLHVHLGILISWV